MKLVVITGCLGLIGSHLTKRCLELGWQVYGIDKVTYAANRNLIQDFKKYNNFLFVKEDIATLSYLPDCDYVINVAAESHVGNSIVDSKDFIHSNVTGVKNLLDLIRKKQKNVDDLPVLLHFSTDEVYGDITEGSHTELDILNPSNPYSASKAAIRDIVLCYKRENSKLGPTISLFSPKPMPTKLRRKFFPGESETKLFSCLSQAKALRKLI